MFQRKPICRDYVRMSFYIKYIYIACYIFVRICGLTCLCKQIVGGNEFFHNFTEAVNSFKNHFDVSRS